MSLRVETVMLAPTAAQGAERATGRSGIEAIADVARRAEAVGFDGLTFPEAGHDPFLPLVIAAEHTRRIALGTNVAIAFPRSPMVTAQLAWDLQRFSTGRFRLGLGTQSRVHLERRFAAEWTEPPGPRLREYLLCLRAIFESFQRGGKPTRFAGEHYRFDLLPSFFNPGPIEHPHVPIYLGAVKPFAARLAGEVGDGVRVHPIATFRYTRDVLVPAIEAGAAKVGRTPAAVDLVGAPFIATAADGDGMEAARSAVKQQIAFHASTRAYHRVLAHHGWQALGDELNRLATASRWAETGALVSDEMLAEWAIVATWDDLAAEAARRCKGLFDTVLLDLPQELARDDARVRAIVAALQRA